MGGWEVWLAGTAPGQCCTRVTPWLPLLSLLETAQESRCHLCHLVHNHRPHRLLNKAILDCQVHFLSLFPLLCSANVKCKPSERGLQLVFFFFFNMLPHWHRNWQNMYVKAGTLCRAVHQVLSLLSPVTPLTVCLFDILFLQSANSRGLMQLCWKVKEGTGSPTSFNLKHLVWLFFLSAECASGLSFGGLVINTAV